MFLVIPINSLADIDEIEIIITDERPEENPGRNDDKNTGSTG